MDTSALGAAGGVLGDIGLYSYGAAFIAYLVLTGVALTTRRYHPLGTSLLVASALTTLWAGAITLSLALPRPAVTLMQLAELARNAAWMFVLLRLLSLRMQGTDHLLARGGWARWFAAGCAALAILLLAAGPFSIRLGMDIDVAASLSFGAWLAISIFGFLLLEQYFRNSNEYELWPTKHLCLGLGILFAYDFFMYAEALLLRILDSNLWQARGVVSVMAAVVMAVSMRRTNREEPQPGGRSVYLSRHVAFHSLTLMASGIYLIAMALAAYFIRYLGGSWGGVLQIAFLCAAGLVLVALLFSGKIRARTRVWLSKNFFSYKYDYRLEWLQFTQMLASGDTDIPRNVTRAIGHLAKSSAGALWMRNENGNYTSVACWEMADLGADTDLGALPHWLQQTAWIIDLREWRESPDVYNNLEMPSCITAIPRAWLVIPLFFGERLQGILLLKESDLQPELNWEDRDLLKVAGRQAASHLAQFQADQALVESRQFEAFNRLSAYVIHDLKNVLAQLSLVVANAGKHKHNPAFVDDMIDTVNNSVERMTKLMAQLRSGAGQAEQRPVQLSSLLDDVVGECRLREPAPSYEAQSSPFRVFCNPDRLHAVFGHLIHNAQDATGKHGHVSVRLRQQDGYAIVDIEDDGEGMDEHFVQQRLFKPFDSTKGLTGMGIGAFESREFIRSIGGDISVQSTPGKGSLFSVRLPEQEAVA